MTTQKYWDACLIRSWRINGCLGELFTMFRATTHVDALNSGLLRIPAGYFSLRQPVRAWVASRLPKISTRLWEQDPDKDVALLHKLENSKYTTAKSTTIIPDKERAKMRADLRKDILVLELESTKRSNRNSATDWGTMSGGRTKATRGVRK